MSVSEELFLCLSMAALSALAGLAYISKTAGEMSKISLWLVIVYIATYKVCKWAYNVEKNGFNSFERDLKAIKAAYLILMVLQAFCYFFLEVGIKHILAIEINIVLVLYVNIKYRNIVNKIIF